MTKRKLITDEIALFNDDCFPVMEKMIEAGIKVDCIIADVPYRNLTKNAWDKSGADLDRLWRCYKGLIKDTGAIILFSQDKLTARLVMSNIDWHRYNLIWNKVMPSGFLNANRMPLRSHEDICIFYKKGPKYHPQKWEGEKPCNAKGPNINTQSVNSRDYGDYKIQDNAGENGKMKYPLSILNYPKIHPSIMKHPCQKPIDLVTFLVRSYTTKGDTILDNFMGSGTTGVASLLDERKFIGIEKDAEYFDLACGRIMGEALERMYVPEECEEYSNETIFIGGLPTIDQAEKGKD